MSFNLSPMQGPLFLLGYFVFSCLTILVARRIQRFHESGNIASIEDIAKKVAHDPYQIAFLRRGRNETLRVAVVSLIERRLLIPNHERLTARRSIDPAKTRRPLDKALLQKFNAQDRASRIYTDDGLLKEADAIGKPLESMGLLPDGKASATRLTLLIAVTAFLWTVAGVAIGVAMAHGYTRLFFLCVMMIAVPVATYAMLNRPRTVLGERVVAFLRDFFSDLAMRRDAIAADAADPPKSELTYLAAVFGLDMLPLEISDKIDPLNLYAPEESPNARSMFSIKS
jgi:uncharacterized protein (TIGR04222 family)